MKLKKNLKKIMMITIAKMNMAITYLIQMMMKKMKKITMITIAMINMKKNLKKN